MTTPLPHAQDTLALREACDRCLELIGDISDEDEEQCDSLCDAEKKARRQLQSARFKMQVLEAHVEQAKALLERDSAPSELKMLCRLLADNTLKMLETADTLDGDGESKPQQPKAVLSPMQDYEMTGEVRTLTERIERVAYAIHTDLGAFADLRDREASSRIATISHADIWAKTRARCRNSSSWSDQIGAMSEVIFDMLWDIVKDCDGEAFASHLDNAYALKASTAAVKDLVVAVARCDHVSLFLPRRGDELDSTKHLWEPFPLTAVVGEVLAPGIVEKVSGVVHRRAFVRANMDTIRMPDQRK
jgi:hypothetical protein